MILTLYDRNGTVKATLSPNESSRHDKELQGDNVLSLSFVLYEHLQIDVNDYVDFDGECYRALERYLPTEKSSIEWEYNVKLYGSESLIKRFLVLNEASGVPEAEFTLTASAREHLRLIVNSINSGMGVASWKVGEVSGSTENIVIDYEGKYCDAALRELAEKAGTEWWIEGETVNLSRCCQGEALVLGYGNGLTSLSRDAADNAKFYTRLFPLGSRRNIDPERYGYPRLQLPGGMKYVDSGVEEYGVIHHYEEAAFSDIYPRRVGVVSSVRSENVTDTDGKPFTIYYFKDDSLTFDPNDYEIGGLVKHVSFQEGSELAGLGADNDHYFEVNYNSETREFEIITIWPYDDDTQLPGGTLVPKAGDRYILWNIRMPDEYYGLAEREYQSAVNEYNQKHALDVSRYKGGTDHVWVEEQEALAGAPLLYIGRRVRLESDEYFQDTGYRDSRITRIVRKVTLPSQMDLEISDAVSTGTMTTIGDALDGGKSYTKEVLGSLDIPQVIKSWETTLATDTNLFSARRSRQEFLSKKSDDKASGEIGFLKGLWIKAKGLFGFSEDGDVTARNISASGDGFFGNVLKVAQGIIAKSIQSANFDGGDSLAGTGYQLTQDDGNGNSQLIVDNLSVRNKAVFNELEVRKYVSMGGNYVFSPATGVIEEVDYYGQDEGEVTPSDELDAENDIYYYNKPFHLLKGETITAYSEDKVYIIEFGSDAWHVVESSDGGVAEYYARADEEVYLAAPEGMDITYTRDKGLLGYEYVKVPWTLRMMPLLSRLLTQGRMLGKLRLMRSTMSETDWNRVKFFRCWLKADDGTTKTINTWREGMLARCQTFDVSQNAEGTSHTTRVNGKDAAGNKMYWRAVIEASSASSATYGDKVHILEDGKTHNYIDLANTTGLVYSGSDKPNAGDNLCCYGDYKDEEYSNLIIIETVGNDAPAIKEFLGVGFTSPNSSTVQDWSMNGKMRTMISPKSGNRFYAPEFTVVAEGDKFNASTALFYWHTGEPMPTNPNDGDFVLMDYDDEYDDNILEYNSDANDWENSQLVIGSYVVTKNDGRVYEATVNGWVDKGIRNLGAATSKLVVDVNGIKTEVDNKISKTTTLQTAEQIVQTAESNANNYTDSQITQTATAIRSEVKGSGNNILNGVQTYTGNTHLNHTSAAADGYVEYESTIYSLYTLQAGKWYTFQCKTNGTFASGHSSSDSQGKCTIWLRFNGTSGYNGEVFGSANLTGRLDDEAYYWTFQCQQTGVYWLRTNTYSDGTTEVSVDFWDIMLENGKVANGWVAPTQGMLSYISQTANNIQAVVENKLGQTGVKIDGNNREIDLIAGKVKFRNNTDTADNQYMSIGSDGKLTVDSIVATNGTFSGTVEATTLKGKVTSTGLEIYDGNNNLRVVIKPQSISSVTFDTLLKMFIGYDGLAIGKNDGTHATFADSGFELLFPYSTFGQLGAIKSIARGLKFSAIGLQVPYKLTSGVPTTYVNYDGFQSGIKVLTENDFTLMNRTIYYGGKADGTGGDSFASGCYMYVMQPEDNYLVVKFTPKAGKTYVLCLGDGAGTDTTTSNNTVTPEVGRRVTIYNTWDSTLGRYLFITGGKRTIFNREFNSPDNKHDLLGARIKTFTYIGENTEISGYNTWLITIDRD